MSGIEDSVPDLKSELEDTREFTDEELIELRLFAEFLRKHPEIKLHENLFDHRTEPQKPTVHRPDGPKFPYGV